MKLTTALYVIPNSISKFAKKCIEEAEKIEQKNIEEITKKRLNIENKTLRKMSVEEWAKENKITAYRMPDFFNSNFGIPFDANKIQPSQIQSVTEWADEVSEYPKFKDFQTTLYKNFIKELNKMQHEKITIKIVNNGFHVQVGCQEFVFTSEKELFQAISEYKKDPEKAREKYCKK